MNTEAIGDWFMTLPPQDRVDWLEVSQTGVGLGPALLRTLPDERRPGHAEAWVFGPVYADWLNAPVPPPAYILAQTLGEFLTAEYSRWYQAE